MKVEKYFVVKTAVLYQTCFSDNSTPPAAKDVFSVPVCPSELAQTLSHKRAKVFYKSIVWNVSVITYYISALTVFPKESKLYCKGHSFSGINFKKKKKVMKRMHYRALDTHKKGSCKLWILNEGEMYGKNMNEGMEELTGRTAKVSGELSISTKFSGYLSLVDSYSHSRKSLTILFDCSNHLLLNCLNSVLMLNMSNHNYAKAVMLT